MNTQLTSYNEQYTKLRPRYQTIRDCINDDVVSGGVPCDLEYPRIKYLVQTPGMTDETYEVLKQLGRFLNVTGATLELMLGAVWRVPLELELPESISYLETNADGSGKNGLASLLKDAIADTLSMGRYGVLVESPQAKLDDDGNVVSFSQGDMSRGLARVYVKPYTAENIVDWDESVINGVTQLSLVKLRELVSTRNDKFQIECDTRYRFLILTEDGYEQRVYEDADGVTQIGDSVEVTDFNGARMDHIPFYFSGSRNNDPSADNPPYYKIADRNIAHYNLDANNRLNLNLYATGTLFITGDNSELGKQTITVGGGNGAYLGTLGSAQLLQLEAGTALPEAIKSDLQDMVMMGAKLSSPEVERTLGEAKISSEQDTSLLADVVSNVQSMMESVIKEVSLLTTGKEEDFLLKINNEFFLEKMTFQERAQLLNERVQGMISIPMYNRIMKKSGFIPREMTDEQIAMEIGDIGTDKPLSFDGNDNAE